jgi:acyl phosphate:glycerol-3-phosphate acyltransferase
MITSILFISIIAYFIGSIPTAVWVGKKFHGVDVRVHGSKNAGATNTFRVLGKKSGWIVLLVDVAKGALCALFPLFLLPQLPETNLPELSAQLVASFFAVLGHIFPLYAQFRGGKGVATSLGIVIGINPVAAAICFSIFLLLFLAFQYVSLGAIIAAAAFPFVNYFILENRDTTMIGFTLVLAVLVIAAHVKNIGRLLRGEENKMNLFKKKA